MFTYLIVVNDNGELKTVSQNEIEVMVDAHYIGESTYPQLDYELLEEVLNRILDERSAAEEKAE